MWNHFIYSFHLDKIILEKLIRNSLMWMRYFYFDEFFLILSLPNSDVFGVLILFFKIGLVKGNQNKVLYS